MVDGTEATLQVHLHLNLEAQALHDRLLMFKEGGGDRSICCFLSTTEIRQSISYHPPTPPHPPGCRSKLHGSKVHGVRARTPGYMIWNKGSFASVKHLLNENMSIQHFKKLSDPKNQFWKIWNEGKMYGRTSSYAIFWCKSARRTSSYASIIWIY